MFIYVHLSYYTQIIKKKLYAFFWYLNDTEKWKKWHFFGLQRGVTLSGNIFKISLEPILKFWYFVRYIPKNYIYEIKKNALTSFVWPIVSFSTLMNQSINQLSNQREWSPVFVDDSKSRAMCTRSELCSCWISVTYFHKNITFVKTSTWKIILKQ
jgi:hypothetical protein